MRILARIWLLMVLLGAGAGGARAAEVVVSIKPLHSLVAGVMQGVGAPSLLIKGAASPHGYSLRPSDARALSGADLVVWIGRDFEAFLAKALAVMAPRARVLEVATIEGIHRMAIRKAGFWGRAEGRVEKAVGEAANPHLWLDPRNAGRIVAAVARALAALDPGNAEAYHDNKQALLARLTDLEAELAAALAPVRDIPYLVFHDAYPYFERRFGLSAVGALSIDPAHKPGARRLVEIRRGTRVLDPRCLFSEPQFTPALAATVIEGTGLRSGVLDPLGAALAPGPEAYFTLMRNLARGLRACLLTDD